MTSASLALTVKTQPSSQGFVESKGETSQPVSTDFINKMGISTAGVRFKIIPCLDDVSNARLSATCRTMNALVKPHQRQTIVSLFPLFIKNLFPGGVAEFDALPIQVVRATREIHEGGSGSKPVSLRVSDIRKVDGKTPSVIIGIEKNVRGNQDFRPFFAIVTRLYKESHFCCIPSLTVQMDVQTVYLTERERGWIERSSYSFSSPIMGSDGEIYEIDTVNSIRQLLAGDALPWGRDGISCRCCRPSICPIELCWTPLLPPCAPFEALVFETALKLKKA